MRSCSFVAARLRTRTRSTRFGPVLLGLLAGLALPGTASAYLLTLTFDDGAYDPTIVSPSYELHGPHDWVESNGIRAMGFWAVDVGTADGAFQLGHTHIQPNWSGRPDGRYEGMHAWRGDLQGLYISLENGASFDVVSIDYSISSYDYTDAYVERLPWSFGVDDARMLLTTDFDPSQADFESQWTALEISDYGLPYRPWFTRTIPGFTNVDGFYLAHSVAFLNVDTIVLDVHAPITPVPEPSTALLIGLGLTALARPRRR